MPAESSSATFNGVGQ